MLTLKALSADVFTPAGSALPVQILIKMRTYGCAVGCGHLCAQD